MQIYDLQKNKKNVIYLYFHFIHQEILSRKLSYIRKFLIQELYFKIIRMICEKQTLYFLNYIILSCAATLTRSLTLNFSQVNYY